MSTIAACQTWTERDLDIVETLALRVRILSLEQIAAGWWSPSNRQRASAQRRLVHLLRGGLLEQYVLPAHPLLTLEKPLFRWEPDDAPPAYEAVAWQLQRRWTEPSQPTTALTASKLAANLFASYAGKRLDPQHATHDLHVGEVYLWYCRNEPAGARAWLGEDAFPKAGYRIKDPDAFLVNDDGSPIRVIEFGGRYDARRVADFHQHCFERDLPYEIW